MRKKKVFGAFFIIIINLFPVLAQKKINTARLEAQAKNYFKEQNYHQALPIFLQLDSIKPNQPAYIFPIGVCLLNTSYDSKEALKYFKKCLNEPYKYHWSLYYYAGKAFHLSHEMDDAIHNYNLYKEQLVKDLKKNKETIEKVDREIQMCREGQKLMDSPINIDIINMGSVINSPYPDYGAVISADQKELIFTSCRPNTTGGQKDSDGKFFEDLYISYQSDSSGWSTPENMGDSVNTSGNDASVALSEDGQELILFRYVPNPLSFTSADLFVSILNGKNWGKATALPEGINSPSYEASASISPNGKILYFSSDRPGGYGGTDVYMVKQLPNGEWATPQNLGDKINTAYNEDSPHIHSDGITLYFSSQGHNTMGGYDIFSSTFNKDSATWNKPINIGYPLNTAHDDVHFSWSADGKKVFFSSVREEGYGDQDIYYAVLHKKESTEVMVMTGFVTDSINNQPLGAKITVMDKNSDQLIGIFTSNTSSGKYLIVLPEGHYKLKIEAESHLLCEKDLSIIELQGFELVERNITLCPSIHSEK